MENLSNENIIHIKNENCEYLQFRRLLKYKSSLKHAYGIKPSNFNRVNEWDNTPVIQAYINLCNCIDVDYKKLIKPNQKHTENIKKVEFAEDDISIEIDKYKETDGLITNKENIVLAGTNADCIILLLYDPIKNVIGNIHSGWKGTFQRIAINGVKKMIEDYGSNPKDIICCICPSIRKCHFEVEEDVKNICEDIFSYTNQIDKIIEYSGKKDGKDKWKIDTVYINKIMLKEMGLLDENIVDSGICSVCNWDKIHSYRVEGKGYGLNSAIITLI